MCIHAWKGICIYIPATLCSGVTSHSSIFLKFFTCSGALPMLGEGRDCGWPGGKFAEPSPIWLLWRACMHRCVCSCADKYVRHITWYTYVWTKKLQQNIRGTIMEQQADCHNVNALPSDSPGPVVLLPQHQPPPSVPLSLNTMQSPPYS